MIPPAGGVLDRLAAEGLIEPDRQEAHDGRLRRYYRLTRDGRRALAEKAERYGIQNGMQTVNN